MAVLAPIPMAIDSTAAAANPGDCTVDPQPVPKIRLDPVDPAYSADLAAGFFPAQRIAELLVRPPACLGR